ncbi:glycosyltransferase family 4 protein [Aetokthonos hydrillicola Thurmond2011]|jgi:glycosyltransferase involved in cell wall biosynthesis|uniref:Glycosyltransferase family 4 protein n=1 Tax=Aetokthonos hydrillicola Thurmond2011 TaxID=2712845 RepID=A0AAP5IE46_9CYAN|nr:glycosyltransferase family 4 protein [Aetokthonos hydrillicola]MBO3460287.1 glycosyltransferase family 4 protein [Aetokthonos hydrillicola CCALA 1050]MBW4587615.1 glycosyltransferase family 4 protein [Aetokthonos hydrillicola CCALA 1050]MDR9898003.1 glycosyltransferase family 4 protein [Aetokthonos hydrillicola Thurmond2011]
MRIGFYFPSRDLDTWSWLEFLSGDLALGGTDSLVLRLAYQLASTSNGIGVYFFSNHAPTPVDKLSQFQAENLSNAVAQARKLELDVVIFNNRANEETVAGVQECEILAQPCIVWDHNGPSPTMANLFESSQFVRRVICVSASQSDELRDHRVFKKTEFVYNFIDIDSSKYTSCVKNALAVCYLGSLTPSKGFQHLAKAWPAVHAIFPEATLTVLGSSKLYNRYTNLGSLGIADPEFERCAIVPYLGGTPEEIKAMGVTFMGLVSPQDIPKIVSSKVLGVVNPNCLGSYETFCVSAIEIQAAGTAVVAANYGGLRETVKNGYTGVLINSERELSSTLIKLLSNPEKLNLMGIRGYEWVFNNFRSDIVVERWISLLQSVTRGEKAYPPKFSWKRSNPRIVARQCIRTLRYLPILDNNVPTLNTVKTLIKGG